MEGANWLVGPPGLNQHGWMGCHRTMKAVSFPRGRHATGRKRKCIPGCCTEDSIMLATVLVTVGIFATAPQVLPVVTVTSDDVAIDRSCRIVIPAGTIIEDKNNHVIDALRYACEGIRKARPVVRKVVEAKQRQYVYANTGWMGS